MRHFTGRALAFLAAAVLPLLVKAVPPGFVDEGAGRVFDITAFNFAPNPFGEGSFLMATAKAGRLFAFLDLDNDPENQVLMLDIQGKVCIEGERGLNTVLAHPNFETTRWVYLYYTWDKFGGCLESTENGAVNRLSRFTMLDNFELDLASELPLLETSPLRDRIHNGGDMAFGNDGYLYVTIGDGGERMEAAASDLGKLLGSVVRLTEDGGIPVGNPFLGGARPTARCNVGGVPPAGSPANAICEEIYAYGFRNPFRFAKDPNQNRFWINDVGGAVWEETSELLAGGNYGWPTHEGPCVLNSLENCFPPPGFVDPHYYYPHTDEGGAAVGGAFVPNGLWPNSYDNTYMFADFVFGTIHIIRKDASAECRTCTPPIPGYVNETFHEWDRPVQLTFGPFRGTQALYYTSRRGTENLRRIYFVGGDNSGPVAILSVSATEGPVGLVVEFDASESSDPDDDVLTFTWDFGDGTEPTEGSATIQHQYETAGTFEASVRVRDFFGFSATEFVTITVGTPPVATIVDPPEGATFAVGDVFTLVGSAVDGDGNSIPDASLFWEVRQHHNTHYHPFLDETAGNNVQISPAPGPEDFEAAGNSYLEVLLTAVDSDGVRTTVSRTIQPKTVVLDFDVEPAGMGLELVLDDYRVTPPVEVLSWEKHQLRVFAPNQLPYVFQRWSHGEEQSHVLEVPPVDPTAVPVYVATFREALPTISPMPTLPPTPAVPPSPPTGSATARPTPQPAGHPTPDNLETNPPAVPLPGTVPSTSGGGARNDVVWMSSLVVAAGIVAMLA